MLAAAVKTAILVIVTCWFSRIKTGVIPSRFMGLKHSMSMSAGTEILVCQASSCRRAGSEAVLLEIEVLKGRSESEQPWNIERQNHRFKS